MKVDGSAIMALIVMIQGNIWIVQCGDLRRQVDPSLKTSGESRREGQRVDSYNGEGDRCIP